LNGSLTYKDSSNNISTFGSNHSTNSAIRHTTEHGWMQFGPGNSSWAHIETDRPRFYFNKGITVDTGAISSYNEDLKFERFPGNTTPHLVLGNESSTFATPLTVTMPMAATPSANIYLDVSGSTNTNGGGGSVIFNTSATAGTLSQHNASISGIRSGTGDGSSELQFRTTDSSTSAAPAMRMIINETGRVGIGVGSPSSKLEVSETMTGDVYHYPLTITVRDDGNAVDQTNDNSGVGIRFKLAGNEYSTPGDSEVGASIVAVRENNSDANSSSGLAFNISQDDVNLDEAMRIDHVGNVGIGTKSPGHTLEVNGSFAATTKSFDIEHPTKDDHRLRYGSLEGPELGVYVRGRSAGGCVDLPEHWTGLVDEETITVNLTAIGSAQDLYVEKIENNKVHIHCEGECFYTIFGERKDVDKLEVEYEHNIQ